MLLLLVLFCMVWLYTLDIQQKEPRIVDDTSPRVRGAHLKPPREASSHTNINAKSPEVRGAPHKLLKPPREASSHININAISPEVRGAPQVLSKPPREASSHTATGPEVRGAPHMLLKPPREASSHININAISPEVRGAPPLLEKPPREASSHKNIIATDPEVRGAPHQVPKPPREASSHRYKSIWQCLCGWSHWPMIGLIVTVPIYYAIGIATSRPPAVQVQPSIQWPEQPQPKSKPASQRPRPTRKAIQKPAEQTNKYASDLERLAQMRADIAELRLARDGEFGHRMPIKSHRGVS